MADEPISAWDEGALRASAAIRSAAKRAGSVRVQVDPLDLI